MANAALFTGLAQVKMTLQQDKAGGIRLGTPLFNLGHFYFSCKEMVRAGERSTCLLDLMWICNAKIMANNHARCTSDATPHSFERLDMKHATFTKRIMDMSTQEIMHTATALMWLLDGDIFDDRERDDEWFKDFEQLLELVRRRAYYLAADTLSPDEHDVEEFANTRPMDEGIMVGNCDSDNDEPDIDMKQLLLRENKQSTQASSHRSAGSRATAE